MTHRIYDIREHYIMKMSRVIGSIVLFAALSLGLAGYVANESVSANIVSSSEKVVTRSKKIRWYDAHIPIIKDGKKTTYIVSGYTFDPDAGLFFIKTPVIPGYTTKTREIAVAVNKAKTGWDYSYDEPTVYKKIPVKIKSTKYIKKAPVRIKSKAYDVYDYPRTLKSHSKFMHHGSSYHSTTFYITKTVKLTNGSSYSRLVNSKGKTYGYINTKATTVYANPKTEKNDSKHTPVYIKTSTYNVYSYPRALHGNSEFLHYSERYFNSYFFVSKQITTASNVAYKKLTYANGKVFGYINAKALANTEPKSDIDKVLSIHKYRLNSSNYNIHNFPTNTTFGEKTVHYAKNYLKTDLYVTKTQFSYVDFSEYSYIVTDKDNLGWIKSDALTECENQE